MAASRLHFCPSPANIYVWMFGPVVVTVCRLARAQVTFGPNKVVDL